MKIIILICCVFVLEKSNAQGWSKVATPKKASKLAILTNDSNILLNLKKELIINGWPINAYDTSYLITLNKSIDVCFVSITAIKNKTDSGYFVQINTHAYASNFGITKEIKISNAAWSGSPIDNVWKNIIKMVSKLEGDLYYYNESKSIN